MKTENLSTLKIHKLSKVQYERELAAGRIEENALYLTPDEESDSVKYTPQTLTESQKAQARVNIGAAQIGETSSALPEVTPSDAGKFLVVSSAGQWVARDVPIAEEVEF